MEAQRVQDPAHRLQHLGHHEGQAKDHPGHGGGEEAAQSLEDAALSTDQRGEGA